MVKKQPTTDRPTCPKCGSSANVIPIHYGLPVGELPDENEVALGGCCVSPDSPIWHCKACKAGFGRLDSRMEFRPIRKKPPGKSSGTTSTADPEGGTKKHE